MYYHLPNHVILKKKWCFTVIRAWDKCKMRLQNYSCLFQDRIDHILYSSSSQMLNVTINMLMSRNTYIGVNIHTTV